MLVFFTEENPKTCIDCRHAVCNYKKDVCTLTKEDISKAIEDDLKDNKCPLRKVPSLRSSHNKTERRKTYYNGFNDAVRIIVQGKRRVNHKKEAVKEQPQTGQLTIDDILGEFTEQSKWDS